MHVLPPGQAAEYGDQLFVHSGADGINRRTIEDNLGGVADDVQANPVARQIGSFVVDSGALHPICGLWAGCGSAVGSPVSCRISSVCPPRTRGGPLGFIVRRRHLPVVLRGPYGGTPRVLSSSLLFPVLFRRPALPNGPEATRPFERRLLFSRRDLPADCHRQAPRAVQVTCGFVPHAEPISLARYRGTCECRQRERARAAGRERCLDTKSARGRQPGRNTIQRARRASRCGLLQSPGWADGGQRSG